MGRSGARSPFAHGVQVFLFLFVGSGIFVLSLPEPSMIGTRSRWQTERTRQEFEAWGRPFGWSADEVDALLWPLARQAAAVGRQLRRPYHPLTEYLGFYQSWRMFSTPNLVTYGIEVDVRRAQPGPSADDDGFEPLYRSRSSIHDWRRRQLDNSRMRKLFARAFREGRSFLRTDATQWIARQVKFELPDATQLRLEVVRFEPPSPEAYARGAPVDRRVVESKVVPLESLGW